MKRLLILVIAVGFLGVPSGHAHAAFAGRNGLIVYAREQSSPTNAMDRGIYVVTPDGAKQRQLRSSGMDPEWSPSGKRMAFSEYDPIADRAQVFVMSADGTNVKQVTHLASGADEPSWSPSGGRIVFRNRYGRDLFIVVLKTGRTTRLKVPRQAYSPAWSPDGHRILFAAGQPDGGTIYSIRPDGSHRRQLTESAHPNFHPSWSPTGARIVFQRGLGGRIFVMDANGTHQRELTRGKRRGASPSWSPDGRRIVFTAGQGVCQPYALAKFSPSGSHVRCIVSDGSLDMSSDWQPR
ncbi:MAG: hypothetical protein M3290_04505 [Actinomycetota bacterium]|nr:hypothetical protein [Actinomycetota bacterium]